MIIVQVKVFHPVSFEVKVEIVEVSFKLQHWMVSRIPFYTCGFNLSRMDGSMFVKLGW
jgi:hypothetical protein